MSRDHRRREEPASSHWEPRYSRSYCDEYSWRRHAPPTTGLLPRRSFNYWQEEAVVSTSYYPQPSHGQQSSGERWHDDSRPWHAESSYSGPRRDPGPVRHRDDRQPRRDGSAPYRNPPRQADPSYTPPPYIPRLTFPATSPVESIPPSAKLAPSDSSRKTSPPPAQSSRPSKPSSGYLSLSQEPSEVLQDPRTSRKLLVLDLNGTLLIRSPRSRASSGPQLRSVQPRPYMQSFRQFLFCPETKAWLDTMVWSSAQPHSVDDMVNNVFGATKNELKAVWNRKSLGLSEAEYHRKTAATKDLTKPWDLFASSLNPGKLEGRSVALSQPRTIHSAFTTLLLDDSPHKAVLQPYNHVCIPEYDSTRRRHDLRSLEATKEHKGSKQNKRTKQKSQVITAVHSADQMVAGLSLGDGQLEFAEEEPYDETLLGVIGILDAVKLQNNVAGWIRKGGLWAIRERQREVGALSVKHHAVEVGDGKTVWDNVVPTGNHASSTSDPAVTTEQARTQPKTWSDDLSIVAYWVARGRRVLVELGIQVVHGVTG